MTASTSPIREVVIVDPSVSDWKTLTAGINPNIPVILLPSGANGLESIADALSSYGTLDAVHLVSHGGTGRLSLGDLQLTNNNLATQSGALAAIASHLTPDSDLLIYGCSVAAGDSGHAFVDALSSALNGVDIAASTDRTGPLSLGGDWDLEYAVGDIETVLPFTVQGMQGIDECLGCHGTDFTQGGITITTNSTKCGGTNGGSGGGGGGGGGTSTPSTPSPPDLIAASDSGVSNSDNITKITTPTFTGTADSGATVTLYDGSTVLGTATATGGNWSITPSSSLAAGSHTITAKATVSGNTSAASSALTITIDTTAPTTTITNSAFSADTGSSGTDFITKTASQAISGTLSASLASGETVYVSLDNGTTWTAATTSVGSSTWSLSGQTLSGSSTLKIKVTDTAGNDGTVSSQAYVLDTTAPTTTIATTALSADTGSSATDFITKTASQTISGTLSANLTSGETVYVSLNNGTTWSAATASVGSNIWSLAGQTLSGSSTLKIKLTDTAGNDGTVSSQAYVLDTTAPSAPSTPDLTAASDSGSSSTDNITSNTTPTFTGTAESGATVTLYDTNGTTVLGTGTATGGNWSITSSLLAEGAHTITAKATDAAGNVSSASSGLSVTVDTTVPTAGTPVRTDLVNPSGTSFTFTVTYADTNGSGLDTSTFGTGNVTVTDAHSNTLSITGASASGNTVTYTVTPPGGTWDAGDAGSYTIDINGNSVKDLAGNAVAANAGAKTFNVTVNTPPALGGSFLTAGIATVGDSSTIQPFSGVTVTDADNNNVSISITYTAANGTLSGTGLTGSAGNYTLTAAAPAIVQSYLQALVFTPTNNQVAPGNTLTTTFTLTPNDGTSDGTADSSTVITTTSINDAPTDIALSANTVSTFDAPGTTVGTLSDTDVDVGGPAGATYSINSVKDPSNNVVNGAFSISGTSLNAASPFSLSSGTYTVSVHVDDGWGGTYNKDLSINVSSALIVSTNSDSGSDATVTQPYAVDAADGSGLSLREALSYASGGNVSIGFAAGLANGSITLGSGATVANNTSFDTDAANTLTIAGQTLTLSGNLGISNGSGDTLTLGSALSGAGTITKSGAGKLILTNGGNSAGFSGGITVTGGTLSAATDANLPAGTITLNGGTLNNNNATPSIDNAVTLGASNGSVFVANGSLTLSGTIAGSGALQKSGGGTLTLSGTNTYSGGTTINGAGGVTVTAGSSLGSGSINLNTLLTISGIGLTLSNGVALGASATVSVSSSNATLSGVISGANGLTKTGAGTLTLSGTNTYTGTTTVSSGTLSIAADANLGAGAISLASSSILAVTDTTTVDNDVGLVSPSYINVASGKTATFSGLFTGTQELLLDDAGTLVLSNTGNEANWSGDIHIRQGTLSVANDDALSSGNILLNNGAFSISGTTTIDNAIQLLNSSTVETADNVTLSGAITGGSGLSKTGTGSVTLAHSSTAADVGTTAVNAGTLALQGNASSNAAAYTGQITVSSGATLAGSDWLSNTLTIAAGGKLSPGVTGVSDGVGRFTIDTGANLVEGGTLEMNAASSASYDQIVVKNGTVTLTGSTLSFTLKTGYVPNVGDHLTLIDNQGSSAVVGTFTGLNEGGTLTVGSASFQISYVGGTGNDVVLTRLAPPADDPPPTPPVPTPPPPAGPDNDGVSSTVEDAAPGLPTSSDGNTAVAGDGNGDGIKDSTQSQVTSVAFLDTSTAVSNPGTAKPVYVTLVADSKDGKVDSSNPAASATTLNNVKQLDAPANLPDAIKMPLGLISFSANVATASTTESFSLYVDPSVGVNGYWKKNTAGTWVNLASAAYGGKMVSESGKLRLDFQLKDGGEFDADGKADGVITDPGAAAYMQQSIVGLHADLPASGFWF